MTSVNTPTLFERKGSPFWYIAYTDPTTGYRMQKSGRTLGLFRERYDRSEALDIVMTKLGMTDSFEEYTLTMFRDDALARLKTRGRSKATINETRIAFDHMVAVLGSGFNVKNLKRSHVSLLQSYLLKKGDTPATINKICRHIRAALTPLYLDSFLDRNPFERFEAIREKNNKQKHLTIDQLAEFLVKVESYQRPKNSKKPDKFYESLKRLVYIYLGLGIRRTEVLFIRRENVDMKRGRVRVMNVKDREKNMEWLTIPEDIIGDFEWFLDNWKGDHPFMFCHPDTVGDFVKARMREADLPESLHLHSLRHTYATSTLEAGENHWRLKDQLRWSSIQLLEKVYSHTSVDDGKALKRTYDLRKYRTVNKTVNKSVDSSNNTIS